MFDINEKGIKRREDPKFQKDLVEPFAEKLEIYNLVKVEDF